MGRVRLKEAPKNARGRGAPSPKLTPARQLLLSLRNPCMLPHLPPLPSTDKDHQASGHRSPMTLLSLPESSSLSSPPPADPPLPAQLEGTDPGSEVRPSPGTQGLSCCGVVWSEGCQ